MKEDNGFLTFNEAMEILKAGGMVAVTDWRRFEYITLEKGKVDQSEFAFSCLLNGFPRDLFEVSEDGSYSYPSLQFHDVFSITSPYQPSTNDILRAKWAEITPADLDVHEREGSNQIRKYIEPWRMVL